MKGGVIIFIFFALGFMLASAGFLLLDNTVPAGTRLAYSPTQVESTQRIPFEAIKVFSNEVKIEYPGLQYARVKSDSMAPLLTRNSVVFEKVPLSQDEIALGDIISFYEPSINSIVLHMAVGIVQKDGKTYYQTKGIANEEIDEWLVPYENVKGIMVGTFR
jgi:signal peptidase I